MIARLHSTFVTERCTQPESLWSNFAHTGKEDHSGSCSGHLRTSVGYVNAIKIMYLEIGREIRDNGKPLGLDCRGLEAALSAENDCWLCLPKHCIKFPRDPTSLHHT